MSENEKHQLHAHIEGHVQGVGFRYYTLKSARDHDLTGWVRNLRDGRVEVLAEGEHKDLNQLLADLRKGPVSADVRNVDYEFNDPKGEFDDFRVRSTV